MSHRALGDVGAGQLGVGLTVGSGSSVRVSSGSRDSRGAEGARGPAGSRDSGGVGWPAVRGGILRPVALVVRRPLRMTPMRWARLATNESWVTTIRGRP